MREQPTKTSFGSELGGGCGCLLLIIGICLFFNIGGITTAIAHRIFGG